jgi:hypothetical protein
VHQEAAAEFGFEPGGLRGHEAAFVGDGDELFDAGRVHADGHLRLAVVDALLQLAGAADAADEVDVGVAARVGDAEVGFENVFAEAGDVESSAASPSSASSSRSRTCSSRASSTSAR